AGGVMFGILLVFGGAYSLVAGPGAIDERLARYAGVKLAADGKKKKEQKLEKAVDVAVLTSDVEDKRFTKRVQRDLARANLSLKVSEYYAIRLAASFGLGAIFFVFRDPISGLVGLVVGYFGPRFYVGRRIGGRLDAFNKQLPDTITLISNSLRAGSSFLQSIELVSRESPPPMGEEMGRVVREVNLGLGMEEALHNMVRRINSEDLDLMVT